MLLGGAKRLFACFGRRALCSQLRCTGTSSEKFVYIARERLDELLDAEVGYLSRVPIHSFTLQEVLALGSADSLAACILNDVPKRFAVRIRMIESLAGWDHIPELNKLHSSMRTWYRRLRLIDPQNIDLQQLTETTRAIRREGSATVGLVALGIYKLQREHSEYTDEVLNHFLDGFLLSRIGSNMLLDQYYARAPKEAGGLARKTGIISPRCDAVALCKQAAAYASRICQLYTGQLPVVLYDNYEAGKGACQPDSPCYFSYIPGYLRYIMVEILKNSFKATLSGSTAEQIAERPIHVLICRDEYHVAIRVSDRAGGIPTDVGDRIWSYLYGAAARGGDEGSATPLSGYGVGLPVSRLHARYLGGQLQLTTYPGFGTDVYVRLPRITSEQVEEIKL